ncbi:MAG TPA: hypothetical protein VMQ61_03860 [Thermoanaerobaculia bacterium]|nr:hypothetical protein [Thermoanaerobaculia bacterium]
MRLRLPGLVRLSRRGLFLASLALTSSGEAAAVVPLEPSRLDLHFVRNEGQADPAVAYSAATFAGTVYVTREGELVHSLARPGDAGWTLTERFVGGRAVPTAADCSAARASYFLGNDPKRWQHGVETSESVRLGEVWDGIEVDLRSRDRNVEKVFTVSPGANAARIRMRIDGARSLDHDDAGALVAETGLGPVVFSAPEAYQVFGAVREPVAVSYRLDGGEYGFVLGPHDPARAVVIDPILQSTYVGGSGLFDQVNDIDATGTYVAGFTNSSVFPGTAGGAQPTSGGGNQDGFVAKFSPDLTTLEQATFIGGSGYDTATAIATITDGLSAGAINVFVSGETASTDFPGTSGAPQASLAGGTDLFVAHLNSDLTSIEATYYGGTANDHAVRAIGGVNLVALGSSFATVYVGGFGESKDLPHTAGGAQSSRSADSFAGFVVNVHFGLNTKFINIPQATYVGSATEVFALAVATSGGDFPIPTDVYAAGVAGIPPKLSGGAQTIPGGGTFDAFVTLISPDLTSFVRSTYFGGEALDTCFGVAVNGTSGDVYITGSTASLSLPGALGGTQPVRRGPSDGYVARFKGDLTQLLGSTYFGGTGGEGSSALDINPASGDVYIAGTTDSTRMPGTTAGAQRIYAGGGGDCYVARFNAELTKVLGSTFLGGSPDAGQPDDSGYDESITIRYDVAADEVVTAGYTSSSDFPKTAGGAQVIRAGAPNDTGVDGFVSRLSPDLLALSAPVAIVVDPSAGASSDGNGVLEPGETVAVQPTWKNETAAAVSLSGAASAFTGPAGATYTLTDAAAGYGTLAAAASKSCTTVPNCFSLSISNPATRPASHWDVTFIETPSPADAPMQWTLHVGDSFTDVPRSYPFYRTIETLFHNGVTLGCTATTFCLSDPVPRINMAIFIARAIAGGAGNLPDRGQIAGQPYSCTFATGVSLFADVAPTDQGCPAAHYLLALNVANGCSPTTFCPTPNVTRGEMSIFMARGIVAPGGGAAIPNTYGPDPETGRSYSCATGSPNLHFTDVFTSDLFCKHVHFLWARGIIDGCGGTLYCPGAQVTRDAMAKFLSNSFALPLYAP